MRANDFEGSPFPAVDADGRRHTLTPLFRLKPVDGGWERDPSPEYLLGLRTGLRQWADRSGKGRYRLADRYPEAVLTSEHADAV